MPYHFEYLHEDLYPDGNFHEQRIDDFESAFETYITPKINPVSFITLEFEYDISNFKFKLIGRHSYMGRIRRVMEMDISFYRNYIDPDIPLKPNAFI
ncbi:hypothetical protein [Galbibacter sp. BG1]